MKKMFNIFMLTCLQLAQTFAQKVNPMEAAAGIDPKVFSHNCAILDHGKQAYNFGGNTTWVYESANNARIFSSDANGNSKKEYAYEAGYKLGAVTLDAKNARIWFELLPSLPDKMDLVRAMKGHRGNVDVSPNQLQPACMLGYELSYPGAQIFRQDCGGGKPVDEKLKPYLQFSTPEEASDAYGSIANSAGAVSLTYAFALSSSQNIGLSETMKSILQSQAFRDFISPVMGKTISLFQARIMEAAMLKERNTEVYREGNDPFSEKLFLDYWRELMDIEHKQVVTFEELANGTGAARHLANFENDPRYRPDEEYRIATDAKQLTSDEWRRKYHDEFKRKIGNYRKAGGGGGGGFSIGKIFSINGNGNGNSEKRIVDELEKMVETEDCGKKFFEESYKYEWDGKRYIPKGIIASEFSKALSEAETKYTFIGRVYNFSVQQKTFELSK